MREILTTLIFIFASNTYAVGWEEVSPGDMKNKGISVHSEYRKFSNCTSFEVLLPASLFFEGLGNREFFSAIYVLINDGPITFPLSGTRIDADAIKKEKNIEVKGICVSDKDLSSAYLVANYWGGEGTIPMVVYFKLQIEM